MESSSCSLHNPRMSLDDFNTRPTWHWKSMVRVWSVLFPLRLVKGRLIQASTHKNGLLIDLFYFIFFNILIAYVYTCTKSSGYNSNPFSKSDYWINPYISYTIFLHPFLGSRQPDRNGFFQNKARKNKPSPFPFDLKVWIPIKFQRVWKIWYQYENEGRIEKKGLLLCFICIEFSANIPFFSSSKDILKD